MAYLKPQAPLIQGADYVYPITTADQVVLSDGTRLDQNGVITVDQATNATNATEAAHAAEADNATTLNGKDAKYYSRPRNLLANSDFEIAQAGYGGYHGAVIYAADRWMQNDTTVRTYEKVTHNGHGALKCASATRVQQKLYLVEGQTYTGAFYINDKLYLHSFTANGGSSGSGEIWINKQSDGTYMFIISGIPAGGVVSEPVLYPGTYTADNLPPYVPKGYAVELAECQRYARHYGDDGIYCYCYSNGYVSGFIFELPMVAAPDIIECQILRLTDFTYVTPGDSHWTSNKGISYFHVPDAVVGEWYRIATLKLDANL